ncbi:MAG TPA: CBS domain-containing protein [Solirubrobacterales bacterium]|jgi:predicted transcriptional regulator|nr:CBS domain-containing protein [Solirubrobacterales bacterium]
MSATPGFDPQTGPLASLTVADFATTGILSVQPDAPLEEVAWLMASNRVHAVAVVDDEAAEPPVIRDVDVVAATVSGHYPALRARDIAGTDSISIGTDDPLDRAAQLLVDHGVTHLIIRDRRRVPSGILSTLDIARAIAGRGGSSTR